MPANGRKHRQNRADDNWQILKKLATNGAVTQIDDKRAG
jgi:hypothetical protein